MMSRVGTLVVARVPVPYSDADEHHSTQTGGHKGPPLRSSSTHAPTDNPDFGAQVDAYWTPTRGVATEFTCYEKKPDASGLSVLTKLAGVPKRLMGFTPRMV